MDQLTLILPGIKTEFEASYCPAQDCTIIFEIAYSAGTDNIKTKRIVYWHCGTPDADLLKQASEGKQTSLCATFEDF